MKVAVIQLNSKLDWDENLKKIQDEIDSFKDQNVEAVFLPECFASMSNGLEPSPFLAEKNNSIENQIYALATKNNMALIGGSVAYRENERVLNRVLNISEKGELLGQYDKIHLFSIELKTKSINKSIDEADIYHSGSELCTFDYKGFKFGINVCFDLRFSEQALKYWEQGCNVLTYASAFTIPTGKAHWHSLLRARAIETQSYVIASAQCGVHNERISTFGHSLVIDPWGKVLLDLEDGAKSGVVELDREYIDSVRGRIPMKRS